MAGPAADAVSARPEQEVSASARSADTKANSTKSVSAPVVENPPIRTNSERAASAQLTDSNITQTKSGSAPAVGRPTAVPAGGTADPAKFGGPLQVKEATLNPNIIRFRDECDAEAVTQEGVPVLPAGATDIVMYNGAMVDEEVGPLASVYPDLHTETDEFNQFRPCDPSIGGYLPPGVNQQPTAGELDAEQFLNDFDRDNSEKFLDRSGAPVFPPIPNGNVEPCRIGSQVVPCDSPQFLISGQPFEGRDIIYVHGLATEHLRKWLANDPAAHKLWPQDAAEFMSPNGYFRKYAEEYWKDHIHENLFDPTSLTNPTNPNAGYQMPGGIGAATYAPKSNRYLLVSWSSAQTLEYAQHSFLTQMRAAMVDGTNVVTPPTYDSKRYSRPFCANGCIVISHSTGGLIVSSALGLAKSGHFGFAATVMPNFVRAHVAFNGAISGSRLATVGMALGVAGAVPSVAASTVLCPVKDMLFGTSNTCDPSVNTGFVVNTVLRDLMPFYAQQVWGSAVEKSPVPTVTVAGGHPKTNYFIPQTNISLTKFILPGLDDGVVTMNSACGNPLHVTPGLLAASGVKPRSYIKAFDMGIPTSRAIRNFVSHLSIRGPQPTSPYIANACTPWLTPTGMVLSLDSAMGGTDWDVRRRYKNHYSFIQGSMDHSHDGGSDASNRWPSALGQPASVPRRYLDYDGHWNDEEMSAITDAGIFAKNSDGTYLVHPAFAGQMYEYRKGRKCCSFKLFGRRYTWWFWKRTYNLLYRYREKASAHYVYEYVGRR